MNPSYEPTAFDSNGDLEQPGLPEFLKDPWGMLRRRWLSLMLVTTLGLLGTVAFIAYKEPVYEAKATVLITTQQIPERFVQSTVPEDGLERVNAMITEILARDSLALLTDRYNLYPDLRDAYTLAEIIEMVRDDIQIEFPAGLGSSRSSSTAHLFTISFTAHSPEVAADVANDLAGRMTNASFRLRNQQAKLTSEFLRSELERTEMALRDQNAKVTAYKEEHRGELPDDLSWNLQEIDRLQQQRQALSLRRSEYESQITLLNANSASEKTPRSPAELRLEALREALVQERGIHMDEHPNVKALEQQVAALESELAADDGFWSVGSSADDPNRVMVEELGRNLGRIDAQMAQIDHKIALADARIAQVPLRREQLAELIEREGVQRARYLEFLAKVEEAELAANLESAQQGERISILDRAEPPSSPTRERWKYLVAGIVASFGAGFAIAAIGEINDPVVLTEENIERATSGICLGSVPRIA